MKNYSEIIAHILKVHNKLNLISKKPRDFGTGDLLYSTEIHTIVTIMKNPGNNLTELSYNLGVSKSATSKVIKKLLQKEYIIKSRPRDNQKEVIFNLTYKGKIAFKEHEKFSKEAFKKVYTILENTNNMEFKIIKSFLQELSYELDKIE